MGQILGQYMCDIEKKFGLYFFFSFFSCIFALSDICFGEYGLISAFVLHIQVIILISIPI